MRIKDWRVALFFLVIFGIVESSFGATTTSSPILVHQDPKDQKEFQNVYQMISRCPAISISNGAPGFSPQKQGDIDISTTTQKVYIATASATSSSWVPVN